MVSINQSHTSENKMTQSDKYHNGDLIHQHSPAERKLTSLQLAKQYLSQIRNQSFK